MLIKVTPKKSLLNTAVIVAPRATRTVSTEALSTLATDTTATRKLTKRQAADEVRVAYAIIAEMLPRVGLTVEQTNIRVSHNSRFSCRMGDARCTYRSWDNPQGAIRISSHALWRRATAKKRRNTVIHELAHVLADAKAKRCVGHGRAWKTMMRSLGEKPTRCHTVNRDGLRRRSGRQRAPLATPAATIYTFRIGEFVSFTARGGLRIFAHVTKRNRKTVEVRNTRGKWRVSPVLLKTEEKTG